MKKQKCECNNRTAYIIAGLVVLAILVVGLVPSMTGNAVWWQGRTARINPGTQQIGNSSQTPKNCMAHSFSQSSYENGTSLCKEQTRNNCLIGEVTMNIVNDTTSNLMSATDRFIGCNYNFEDFDEDDEIIEQGIIGLRVYTDFEVICCD